MANLLTPAQYLKQLVDILTGSGSEVKRFVGYQTFDGSVTANDPIKPSSNGVSGDSYELIVSNTGSEPLYINTGENSSVGTYLPSKASFTTDKMVSTDDVHYLYFPNNAGEAEVTFKE